MMVRRRKAAAKIYGALGRASAHGERDQADASNRYRADASSAFVADAVAAGIAKYGMRRLTAAEIAAPHIEQAQMLAPKVAKGIAEETFQRWLDITAIWVAGTDSQYKNLIRESLAEVDIPVSDEDIEKQIGDSFLDELLKEAMKMSAEIVAAQMVRQVMDD